MIFNQFEFLFLFLPAVLALAFAPGLGRARPWILIAASFVFYGMSGVEHALVLAAGTLWVFAATRSDAVRGSRLRLIAAAVPPVAALVFYKYLGFFLDMVPGFDRTADGERFSLFTDLILPAGISFFTFQLVAFAVDRYRGDLPVMPRLRDVVLYISFFPQLVAGPILRYADVARPLADLVAFRPTMAIFGRGAAYVVFGLAAKVLIADTLGHLIETMVADPGRLPAIGAFYVVFAYSFQIYFDFYGYSLIAIGLGLFFGFRFPNNFLRPYEALNPREFWRRWHVTLSYWIRDYAYLPLGGNRAYARNILIVFALCGLWHGAGWTFVAWGLFHAALVIGYHHARPVWDAMPALLQRVLTFALVSFGDLFLFDFAEIRAFGRSLAGLAVEPMEAPDPGLWLALGLAALATYGLHFERMADRAEGGIAVAWARSAAAAALFVLTLFFLDRSQTFIYFRF